MPRKTSKSIEPKGNLAEKELFTEVNSHYVMAKEDLESRMVDWDKKDELFRSHIPESGWPYNSIVFDPRVFTAIFEKTSRLMANKPRGRLVPREGGDSLGAKINNELLSFQWDDNERVDNLPMIAKWATMDMNTRKYGASFALAKWHYQTRLVKTDQIQDGKPRYKRIPFFDGPNFRPLVNRDCLPNPSYSTIKNWFQHRDYVTVQELQSVNDASRTKPVYQNLDLLLDAIKKENTKSGDTRESNYQSKNKSISKLTDYLGRDEYFKTIEIVTEYRNDRWITFAPKHGVIIRDIPNPYDHGQIPVIMLKYYSIDDDLYGLSEIEPVEKLQRATNALVCQYLDAINMSLYTPLKIRATGVQMHTLEFGPNKKWIMNDPTTDVVPHQTSPAGVTEFTSTYRFMIGAMQEALGETSAAISNMTPGAGNKTATEVKDLAIQRNARDNFNQIFLSEALKKQMGFWFLMNKQMLFNSTEQQKVIRIVGKDAIAYFQRNGLDGMGMTDDGQKAIDEMLQDPEQMETLDKLMESGNFNYDDLAMPLYPVQVGKEVLPKFSMDSTGEMGNLILEADDLSGTYDYIPDIESMSLPNDEQILALQSRALEFAKDPAISQQLQMEGYKIKTKEMIEDFLEKAGMKDADKYFEKIEGGLNGINPNGAGGVAPGRPGMPNGQVPGMAGGSMPMVNNQA